MPQKSSQIQTQALQQTQTLSPQQILVVKLLELPKQELEERIQTEILDNPALETVDKSADDAGNGDYEPEGYGGSEPTEENNENPSAGSDEDLSLGDYPSEDDIPDYKLQEHNRSRGETMEEIPFSDTISFYDELKDQLAMQNLPDKARSMAEYLIGSLDDDGLLRKPLSTIAEEMAIYQGIDATEDELRHSLAVIQGFDPAGIGARSLQECLLLQIRRKPDSPLKKVELNIVEKCLEDFTRKNKDKVMQRLGISEETYAKAVSELVKLNPRPGSSLGEAIGKNFQQIVPDFIVETQEDGTVTVSLNNWNVPALRLSREFSQMLDEQVRNKENQSKSANDAFLFLKQKVDAAQGFINAIKQRQHTLMVTMNAIVKIQKAFFQTGDESSLKPMILKDVAELAKLDISTVSRVSNSKYAQTNFGLFPLKFFFITGFKRNEADDEKLSSYEIKRILQECVDEEDKTAPLTDDELAASLQEKGYPVARRTVAKYRLQLNIPIARLRRN